MSGARRTLKWLVVGFVALAIGFGVLLWLTPVPPPPPPPPPQVTKKPAQPLQADAEGRYFPGYRFAVGKFRFKGFSLRPDAVVTFATAAGEQDLFCPDPKITAAGMRLRCDFPQVGTVTIEGKFLARLATTRQDVPVVSAFVTVRSGSGEVLYSAKDAFEWRPAS